MAFQQIRTNSFFLPHREKEKYVYIYTIYDIGTIEIKNPARFYFAVLGISFRKETQFPKVTLYTCEYILLPFLLLYFALVFFPSCQLHALVEKAITQIFQLGSALRETF